MAGQRKQPAWGFGALAFFLAAAEQKYQRFAKSSKLRACAMGGALAVSADGEQQLCIRIHTPRQGSSGVLVGV